MCSKRVRTLEPDYLEPNYLLPQEHSEVRPTHVYHLQRRA